MTTDETRCGACERPRTACECLNYFFRKARVIRLDQRKDLCLIGWDDYPYATQVMNHDQDGNIEEHLVPYRTSSAAHTALAALNNPQIAYDESSDKKEQQL